MHFRPTEMRRGARARDLLERYAIRPGLTQDIANE